MSTKSFTVHQRAESIFCKSPMILHVGDTAILDATRNPSTSTDILSFTSDDKNVATVSKLSGKINANAPGTTTIHVYSKDNKDTPNSDESNKTTTCEVIVLDKAQTLSIDPADSLSNLSDITYDPAKPTGEQRIAYEISLQDIVISPASLIGKGVFSCYWYEADGKTVNEDSDTLVSGNSHIFEPDLSQPGKRYYYCRIEYRVSDDMTAAFMTPVVSVTVPGNLKVTFDPNGGSFKNTSAATKEVESNKPVGTLPSENELTPPEGKIFKGWATTAGSYEADVTSWTTVSRDTTFYAVWAASDKLTVWADQTAIRKGESTQVHVTSPRLAITQALTGIVNDFIKPSYTSSNTAIATVDENGIVTGHKPGTSTITVTLGSLTGTLDITVLPPQINSVRLDPETDHIYLNNGSTQVKATIDPSNACEVITYDSSNRSIATVTEDGIITGVNEGTFNLLVLGDGQVIASFPVNVSADPSIATVDASGMVTDVTPDNTTVTVSADDLTAPIEIKVMSNSQPPTITSDLPDNVTIAGSYLIVDLDAVQNIRVNATVTDSGTLSYEWHGTDTLTDDGDIISGNGLDKEISASNINLFTNAGQYYKYIFVRIYNILASGESSYVDSNKMEIISSP